MAEHPEPSPANPSFLSRQVESSRVFFFEETERSPFEVRCGGLERCQADYRINRASFPWFLLEFVHGGRGSVELDGVESALKPGVFFLYGPGMPHRIESDPDKPLVKYFTGFSGTAAAAFLEQHDLKPGMVSQCLKAEPIRRAFDTLIERGSRNSKYSQPLCSAIVQQLLLMCREDAVDARSTDTKAFATFSRVKECIESRFLELGSLDAVASACELDAPYLCRLFSRFHDESPYQFLTRLKMQHAASLLLESDISVKEAAAASGFPDPFHFSRVFKSIHRVPPSRFREAMHDKQPR
ncbi:AraC family transcriptional regulator [Luteolibacter luteus]|uniref:AraC family transcriptional regulator n=1 Tax=Luteolibacter luteus TaxID=2728835 RepID=A0A858RHM2_9BACT|nr:AraC family transcriptional regulator [Luteolibacter luteus]QJE96205.1 AraC family transcriptional regulator [Luteolibacter luteus]